MPLLLLALAGEPLVLSCCQSFLRSAATARASDSPASPLFVSHACAAAHGSAGVGSHFGRTYPRIPPLAAVPVLVVLLVLLMLLLRDSGRAARRAECSCSTICCCLRQKSSWSFNELELRRTPVLTSCLLPLAPAAAGVVAPSACCCRGCGCGCVP
jgi:hypothetical protein